MPALLTRPLSPPIAPCAQSTNAPTSASLDDVELARVDLAGQALVDSASCGEAVLVDVAGGDLGAGLGEAAGEVRAHALGAAGDDDLERRELHARRLYHRPLCCAAT